MTNHSIENRIYNYWQELLHVNDIQMHDNFFALGGDELLFWGLIKKFQKDFNLITTGLNSENFATFYQQQSSIKRHLNAFEQSIVIPLQGGIAEPTIVLIHPIAGTLFPFLPLVKKLHCPYKIYGIQDCALVGDLRYFDSLTEQANYYATSLLNITSDKKLILVGYSAGCSIANEMAYQLAQKGKEIEHLILFDGWTKMPMSIDFRNNFNTIISRQFERVRPEIFFSNQTQIDNWLKILQNRMRILFESTPKKVSVNATIFVPTEQASEYTVEKEMTEGWSQFVKKLNIHYVRGNHENMLDEELVAPLVDLLSSTLKLCIEGNKHE